MFGTRRSRHALRSSLLQIMGEFLHSSFGAPAVVTVWRGRVVIQSYTTRFVGLYWYFLFVSRCGKVGRHTGKWGSTWSAAKTCHASKPAVRNSFCLVPPSFHSFPDHFLSFPCPSLSFFFAVPVRLCSVLVLLCLCLCLSVSSFFLFVLPCLWLSLSASPSLSLSLPLALSASVSLRVSVSLSLSLSPSVSLHLSVCLSACLPVCLSACLPGWLAGWLSVLSSFCALCVLLLCFGLVSLAALALSVILRRCFYCFSVVICTHSILILYFFCSNAECSFCSSSTLLLCFFFFLPFVLASSFRFHLLCARFAVCSSLSVYFFLLFPFYLTQLYDKQTSAWFWKHLPFSCAIEQKGRPTLKLSVWTVPA